MKNPIELRQKRATVINEARAILDTAEKEARDLTAEELEKYDRAMTDAESIRKEYCAIEQMDAVQRALDEPPGDPIKPDPTADPSRSQSRDKGPRATDEYRKAFWNAMRSKFMDGAEARTLIEANDVKGGYLVPEETELSIIKAVDNATIMRQLVNIRQSSTLTKIPIRTQKPVFTWIAESGVYGKTDMDYGMKQLDAHKVGGIIPISEELLADSAVDLEAEIRADSAIALAEALEAAYINGTGVGQPTGILQTCDVGATTAAAGAFTCDEVLDLIFSVKAGYRRRGTLVMKDATALAMMKLTDDNGQYLWQPSVQAGQPERFRSYPVQTTEWMPEIAAEAKSILFGDFSYYRAQDRIGMVIQALIELYAENGEVGFKVMMRTDGLLLLSEAVKCLQQHA